MLFGVIWRGETDKALADYLRRWMNQWAHPHLTHKKSWSRLSKKTSIHYHHLVSLKCGLEWNSCLLWAQHLTNDDFDDKQSWWMENGKHRHYTRPCHYNLAYENCSFQDIWEKKKKFVKVLQSSPSAFRKNPSWRSRKNKLPSFSHLCWAAKVLISFSLNLIFGFRRFNRFSHSFLKL